MRSLIRPTLFMVARIGFSLVVIAWIGGQLSHVGVRVPINGKSASVETGDIGWAFVMRKRPSDFGFEFWPANAVRSSNQDYCFTPVPFRWN